MMLTAGILVVQKVFDCSVECALKDSLTGIVRYLLINHLIGPINKPILVPKIAATCLPDCSTRVAKFSTAADKRLISFFTC